MFQILNRLRIVEASSFVAAPSCGMHLAQLGAEVIRLDTIGGGPDFHRWPLAGNGASLFWEGLNKGKKSIAIDLSRPEGRELATDIVTVDGKDAGLFMTNFPATGFLSHDSLCRRRSDLISVRVQGHADGTQAVDYTVNCGVGLPFMTGPESLGNTPVNHVLPAWDLLAGTHAAIALLAAERYRRETGVGQEVSVPLAELALSTLGHLGQIAEITETGQDRPRYGNALYGAFGRDFETNDSQRIMAVAITAKQWRSLLAALRIEAEVAALEVELGLSFAVDEGLRFRHRERLFPLVQRKVGQMTLAETLDRFDRHAVCHSVYRTARLAVEEDVPKRLADGVYSNLTHPSGFEYPTPGAITEYAALARHAPVQAPALGQHTEEVLADVLGMSGTQIAHLHDRGIVASQH